MLNITTRRGQRHVYIALLIAATLGLSMLFYTAQTPAIRPAFTTPQLPALAVGDWVFRSGTSTESHLIQTLSNGEFSHIGMIVSVQPELLIVHATTNDDPQRSNQVLTSTLNAFIDPQRARSFAIARPLFVTAKENQQAATWLLKQLRQPFVLADRSNTHLYCTTLLADALQHTQTPFKPLWQQMNAPMFSGEYLFPQAFADYPDIEWLYRSSAIQHPQ
ncbi:MAG: YiiX/YebB-like N1pC/P60 family cysteine hydrolase [Pseudomonas sp.]|jgi:hypothetical protein|nr:YiiX/YebB-like N1pC/P60 family cysteine hydrolase [Pseudomonas sp.]